MFLNGFPRLTPGSERPRLSPLRTFRRDRIVSLFPAVPNEVEIIRPAASDDAVNRWIQTRRIAVKTIREILHAGANFKAAGERFSAHHRFRQNHPRYSRARVGLTLPERLDPRPHRNAISPEWHRCSKFPHLA